MELRPINVNTKIRFGGQKDVLANFAHAIVKSQIENTAVVNSDVQKGCAEQIIAFVRRAVNDVYFPRFIANIGFAAKISAKINAQKVIPRMTLPGIAQVAHFDRDVFIGRVGDAVRNRLLSDKSFAENCSGIQYQVMRDLINGKF